jgi:hypothetical protein
MQTRIIHLRGRLYSVARSRPVQVSIPTRCAAQNSRRYPYIEALFDGAAIQPYIHDCTVTIHEGQQTHHFVAFFKRHCRLTRNRSFASTANFRGDCVVIRRSARNERSVVNMRGRDTALADWMVPRYGSPTTTSFYKLAINLTGLRHIFVVPSTVPNPCPTH